MILFGTIFMLPLFLQQAKNYSPFETGLILLPQAIAAGIFMPIGGKLYDKIGARPVVIAGMAVVTGAAFMLTQITAATDLMMIMIPLAMLGAGMGLSMMPLNTHIIQSAPAHLVSRVTSLTNAAQQVMVSFAVAGLATILGNRIEYHMAEAEPLTAMYASYSDTYYVVAGIGIAGILLGFLLTRPKRAPEADSAEPKEVGMMMGH
ncbi:MFS transporter [Paenibacillus tarimensis]